MKSNSSAVKLVNLLLEHQDGLHKQTIIRKLALGSESSFYRALRSARALGNNQIECSNDFYRIVTNDETDELTAMIPQDDELIALLTIQHIISGMTSKALTDIFHPLQKKLDKILKIVVKQPLKWADKVKILDIHYRKIPEGIFLKVIDAISREYVLKFDYTDSIGKVTLRTVSPQHLVRYKDNWYLDAWCHKNNALRIFSLDNISGLRHANCSYFQPDDKLIHEIYAASYGIFSGTPTAVAKIRLTGVAARYVQREMWHPEQKLTICGDKTVELEIPYSKPHELIREVLSWGEEAEVLEPKSLRKEIATRINELMKKYEKS